MAPTSPRQLADLLGEVAVQGGAVSPQGSGTKLWFGNPLRGETQVVSTRKLNQILAYEPDDMTISVEAGTTIAEVWSTLEARGQTIPIDVPAPLSETIGGLIATGLCGPRRLGSGSLRDALIGIQVAYPDGTLGNAGGMVVKNVSGFDLMRMHLGAVGTLGVIASANFKVLPTARAEATVTIERETLDQIEGDRIAIGAGRIRPIAFEVNRVDDGWLESIRIEGRAASVDQMARELADRLGDARTLSTDESKAFWQDLVGRESLQIDADTAVLQVRGRPSDTIKTVSAVLREFDASDVALAGVGLSPGLGTVRLTANVRDDDAASLAAVVTRLRQGAANVLILSAPAGVHSLVDAFGTPESTLELMRQLKRQFDPRSVLNPGRVISEL